MSPQEMQVSEVLRAFEAAEANLEKLENVWQKLSKLIPDGVFFTEDADYDALRRSYSLLLDSMPAIQGWRPRDATLDLMTIAHMRFNAQELAEPEAYTATESAITEPGRIVSEYRDRFNRERRRVVRTAVLNLLAKFDRLLGTVSVTELDDKDPGEEIHEPLRSDLRAVIEQIEVLLGSSVERPYRWGDLRRHLAFGQYGDLLDIRRLDWPVIRPALERAIYGDDDPMPVSVVDLSDLRISPTTGPIPTQLHWERLSAEDFERLIFSLLTSERGYENPNWLMSTSAPDRGRDLAVERVISDNLTGTRRERVIVQCKHWLTRSVNAAEIATLREQVRLWEPPRVDVLIIATSGRFSADAVQLIERQNSSESSLRIESWAESHLEVLLAQRPALIAEFGLR